MASWRSGYAEDCKSLHPGSIPGEASSKSSLQPEWCFELAMIDFEDARMRMVDCQIRPNDVTSYDILQAFSEVPREEFVTQNHRPLAYIDEDLLLVDGPPQRYLMEAMTLSKLIQIADIREDDIVLDVGCATGYSTAILSKLCSSVVAVECEPSLAELATQNLITLNYDNAVVVNGPLEQGYASEGPYDVIIIGGAVEQLPEGLKEQLKEGGRLVVVEGTGNAGVARIYVKEGGVVSGRTVFNSAVMPLPGFEKENGFMF